MRRLVAYISSLTLAAITLVGMSTPAHAAQWYDTWTQSSAVMSRQVTQMASGSGVIVGWNNNMSSPANNLSVSSDGGVSLTDVSNPFGASLLADIAFGNGVFVAVGNQGATRVSTNGLSWSSVGPVGSVDLNSVTYGSSGFVIGTVDGHLYRSTDGTTWTPISTVASSSVTSLAYGNGVYVGTVLSGANATKVITSSDGILWQESATNVLSYLPKGIEFTNGRFVILGQDLGSFNAGSGISSDGVSWIPGPNPGSQVNVLTAGAGVFMAVNTGLGGPPRMSTDGGASWQTVSDASHPALAGSNGVGFGGNRFFLVDNQHGLLFYSDAPAVVPGPLTFSSAAFGSVEVGQSGNVTVTVMNSGSGIATPSAITVAGAGVSVTGGSCAVGTAIAASETCTVSLSWTPTTAGELSGASLTIAYPDGSNASDSAALTGTATANGGGGGGGATKPQEPASTLTLPSRVKFGKTTVLLKKAVVTNAGQTATASVTCRKGKIKRTKNLCKVKTSPSGKLRVQPKKHRIRVTLTLAAPATAAFDAYLSVTKYHVK